MGSEQPASAKQASGPVSAACLGVGEPETEGRQPEDGRLTGDGRLAEFRARRAVRFIAQGVSPGIGRKKRTRTPPAGGVAEYIELRLEIKYCFLKC